MEGETDANVRAEDNDDRSQEGDQQYECCVRQRIEGDVHPVD